METNFAGKAIPNGNDSKDESEIELMSSEQMRKENFYKKLNIVTAGKLLDMNITELPYLVEPLIPLTGVVGLCGSSDTGKSSFLRQLAISIASRNSEFLGFPITAKHNRVIYLTTEDGTYATAYLLNKSIGSNRSSDLDDNLIYLFDTYSLKNKLDAFLNKIPVDLIIIDTMSDLIGGDLNSNNIIRNFLHDFTELSNQYECLFLFLHHTSKRTEGLLPSKNNVIGSQAFEAKMRLLFLLVKDPDDPSIRHLCAVKGNYIPEEVKQKSFKLRFEENMTFSNLNERVPFDQLGKNSGSNNQDAKARVIYLHKQNKSMREISEAMNKEGVSVSKSTASNWIREYEALNPESELAEAGFPDDTLSEIIPEVNWQKEGFRDLD